MKTPADAWREEIAQTVDIAKMLDGSGRMPLAKHARPEPKPLPTLQTKERVNMLATIQGIHPDALGITLLGFGVLGLIGFMVVYSILQ